jgi:hypothetical protein
VRERRAFQSPDPGPARACAELEHERAGKSPSAVVVGHDDRELADVRASGIAYVAGHAHDPAGVEGQQSLVMVMVDLGQ